MSVVAHLLFVVKLLLSVFSALFMLKLVAAAATCYVYLFVLFVLCTSDDMT